MRFALLFILVAAAVACTCCQAHARQPNIILILADDLGYETLRCNGGESYQTPNLDKLAATGVRFDRCNVQPLCTPTRLQLMTGQYNVRNYIAWATIDPASTIFATLLRDAGYATAIAGKWQLGHDEDLPRQLGFDEFCLWQHTRRPPRYANPGLEYKGEERDFKNGEYGPDLMNQFALDFIAKCAKNKSKPFLLYYPMMLTHAPYQPTPDSADWDPRAVGEEVNRAPKHFADMVAYMDKLVGRVVAKVDELGIRDNTLIIFLGDNGTGQGTPSTFRGRTYIGGKGTTTARGMHVPLIANWPGHTPAGATNDDLIDSTDFLPTLCEAAGVKLPNHVTLDGHSFFPQILGQKGQPREWIYTWYARNGAPPIREFVTTKEYKLYRNDRFYNLANDPYEDRPPKEFADLTGDEASAAKKMKEVLTQFADARPAELRKAAGDVPPLRRGKRAAKEPAE